MKSYTSIEMQLELEEEIIDREKSEYELQNFYSRF